MRMKKSLTSFVLCLFAVLAYAQEYKTVENIAYHADAGEYAAERCKLDVYYQDGVKDLPVVVWFHSGGLTSGNKEIPAQLKNSKIIVVGVNYRLLPKAELPEVIDDAAAAVAWTFKNIAQYGGDVNKIYVSGHSAGGYLTNMIGLDKKWLAKYDIDADKIAALVPFSGQVITHFAYRQAKGMKNTQPLIDEFAPLYWIRPDAPKIVIISGDRNEEMLGRYEETAYFWRMLKVVGHPDVTMYEMDGYNHGEMAAPAFHLLKKYVVYPRPAINWNR